MLSRIKTCVVISILWIVVLASVASAAWKMNDDGTYSYVTSKGKVLKSVWLQDLNAGIVKKSKYSYCYDINDNQKRGLVVSVKETLSDEKGTDTEKSFSIYFFDKKNGRMCVKKLKKVDDKYYYFGKDGKAVIGQWVKKRYFGGDGVMAVKTFVGSRYVGANGNYVTGLKKINGCYYYFDKKTGNKLTNTTKKVKKVEYKFDENGQCWPNKASVPVHDTYYTDPEVTDEKLLAAIIYCEAGNQPYFGQLAVGIVITNRMRSKLFPSKLKEVIYATMQFEPARNGSLTSALNGKITVSDSCKKAAAEVLKMYKANQYKITKSNGKKVSLKNYLFFMTKPAYNRLGLKSKVKKLGDHVFFKTWK